MYTPTDHTYANSVPGATLTPENPLAGLNEIARQVRKSGVKRVEGDVVIDDRLFDLAPKAASVDAISFNAPNLDPWPYPITINDNLIDVEVEPGKVGEKPKVVLWRPKVAPYHLQMRAKTVKAGEPTTLSVSPQSNGPVVVSGNIAAASSFGSAGAEAWPGGGADWAGAAGADWAATGRLASPNSAVVAVSPTRKDLSEVII